MPPPTPARIRKKIRDGQSQASIVPSDPRVILPIQIKYRVRGPHRPVSQPVEAMTTVRAIPGAVRIQWIWYKSTRMLVMIWGRQSWVLEASMAKVMSPKPKSAVVSQRSRVPICDAVLGGVSMANVIPNFSLPVSENRHSAGAAGSLPAMRLTCLASHTGHTKERRHGFWHHRGDRGGFLEGCQTR